MVPNRLLIVALGVLATCGVTRAQSWAIELHDNGRLEFPWHSVMNTDTTVTMEGWFRQTGPMSQQMGFSRYQGSAEHKELVIDPGGRLRWLYAGQPWAHGGSCRETDPGVFPADGEWHHYAFSRHADHRWEVYIDGNVVHSGGPSGCCWLTCNIINAQPPTLINGASGMQLRALRVSEIDRYDGPFEPQDQWTSDADTALLLPLEEGAGNIVFDHGVVGQTGAISGDFTWVDLSADVCTAQSYCAASPSSAGTPCMIGWQGTLELSSNYFELTASGAPPLSIGAFFYGALQAQTPLGEGTLCVGGQLQRLYPPVLTNHQGDATLPIDFTMPPLSSGPFAVTPSSTWNFQFWYRDPLGGPEGFNLSGGLEATFCP